MENRHTTLYVTGAFIAGVLLCLGFKDFYPDLEWKFRRWRSPAVNKTIAAAGLADDGHIDLEDHESETEAKLSRVQVPAGIESCIGNTPLFKIKSLSDATGCEILGKAEVIKIISLLRQNPDKPTVSQRWRWKSERPSSSEHDYHGEFQLVDHVICPKLSICRQRRRGS